MRLSEQRSPARGNTIRSDLEVSEDVSQGLALELGNGGSASVASARLLNRLARLVSTLLGRKFESRRDLWTWQLDLLELQRDIQRSIGSQKRLGRRAERDELDHLRILRDHARRLGDAFVWIIFDQDRKALSSLSGSQQVPISPTEGDGDRGVLLIAGVLADKGWGFPVLHDITDMLRIGDVTFVDPRAGRSGLTTFEVKTAVHSTSQEGKRGTTLSYSVKILTAGSERAQSLLGSLSDIVDGSGQPSSLNTWSLDERALRQLGKLGQAHSLRDSQDGDFVLVNGKQTLTHSLEITRSTSEDLLGRIVRRARRTGFAFENLDGAFLYAAYYDKDGLSDSFALDDRLPRAMATPEFLKAGDNRNSVIIHSIPSELGGAAQLHMPHFLYGIPRTSIQDLIHRRLFIVIVVNPAWIYAALEGAGFVVLPLEGSKPSKWGGFRVQSDPRSSGIGQVSIAIENLHMPIQEAIYELRGVGYVVDYVRELRDVAASSWSDLRDAQSPKTGRRSR